MQYLGLVVISILLTPTNSYPVMRKEIVFVERATGGLADEASGDL
jgi:hypothetical protein